MLQGSSWHEGLANFSSVSVPSSSNCSRNHWSYQTFWGNIIQFNSIHTSFFLDQSKRNNRIPLKFIWQLYAFVLLSNFFLQTSMGKPQHSGMLPEGLFLDLIHDLKMTEKHNNPHPKQKNAVIFVLTKIGCFKPTLQIIVTHRERGKQAALHGTTFEADFDDSCLRHGISKHRNTLNI